MHAVEFRTTVSNGTIEIPPEHRGELSGLVKVRVEPVDSPAGVRNLIDELIARPVRRPGFRPLTREEAHAR
jgi:hypothetical protein